VGGVRHCEKGEALPKVFVKSALERVKGSFCVVVYVRVYLCVWFF
jgi:hypothetical protein